MTVVPCIVPSEMALINFMSGGAASLRCRSRAAWTSCTSLFIYCDLRSEAVLTNTFDGPKLHTYRPLSRLVKMACPHG